MIWNDKTETGYPLTGKTVSAAVGVKSKNGSWVDPNEIDGMVHPVDRGNIPEGLPGVATFAPTDLQRPRTPRPPASRTRPAPGAVAAGASRSATSTPTPGSPGAPGAMRSQQRHRRQHPPGLLPRLPLAQLRAEIGLRELLRRARRRRSQRREFPGAQKSDDIDVLANGDNSIEENDFDVNGGSCVHFVKIKTKAIASAKLGESITDTATITDAFTNKTSCLRRHGHLQGLQGRRRPEKPDHLHRHSGLHQPGDRSRPGRQLRSHLHSVQSQKRRHLLLDRHLPQHLRSPGDRHLDDLQRG